METEHMNEDIEKERKEMQKGRKMLFFSWAAAIAVLIIALIAVGGGIDISFIGFQTLEVLEPNETEPHVMLSSPGGSISFEEVPDFRIRAGDRARFTVKANREDVMFTDDTQLFDIDEEGNVDFRASEEDVGLHRVIIIIKSTRGEYYLQDLRIVIEE